MATVEQKGEISGKSATDVYEASLKAFAEAGFEVWKKRPMGWLSLAKKTVAGVEVAANLSARPTQPPSFTLTLDAEGLAQDRLQELAKEILTHLEETLEG
jgi:hypothetical protein